MDDIIYAMVMLIIILLLGIYIGRKTGPTIIIGKEYHEYWKPIYKNRQEHFDKYLQFALTRRTEYHTVDDIARYAAYINYDDNSNIIDDKNKDIYINRKKGEYLNDLRSANIE